MQIDLFGSQQSSHVKSCLTVLDWSDYVKFTINNSNKITDRFGFKLNKSTHFGAD